MELRQIAGLHTWLLRFPEKKRELSGAKQYRMKNTEI